MRSLIAVAAASSGTWPRHDCRLSKNLDSFDFQAVPMVSKAQVMALTAGDSWLEKGANLLLFGPHM
jgi:DNA replication protein DnaC